MTQTAMEQALQSQLGAFHHDQRNKPKHERNTSRLTVRQVTKVRGSAPMRLKLTIFT